MSSTLSNDFKNSCKSKNFFEKIYCPEDFFRSSPDYRIHCWTYLICAINYGSQWFCPFIIPYRIYCPLMAVLVISSNHHILLCIAFSDLDYPLAKTPNTSMDEDISFNCGFVNNRYLNFAGRESFRSTPSSRLGIKNFDNQSLKQTGRANATIKHFIFAGIFRGNMVSW